ncbi:NDP-sugar synthase [Streptomyces californicus]|uniref:nucleotidyltransferase family protein n=1 Tax=Streptomyces californicus TaxID=67351 RepID=UPI0036EFC657
MQSDYAGVIVAGGYGTRLAPITHVLPKVLVPVGRRAMLDILVDQMTHLGIRDIHLLLGHQAGLVRAYVDSSPHLGELARLTLHTDTGDLGTAGPLRRVHARARHLLVMNGDVFTTADLGALTNRHASDGSALTVATTEFTTTIPYGVLHSDDRSRLVTVDEKPSLEWAVSAGIYAVGPEALALVEAGGPDEMPGLIHRCLKHGLQVSTHRLTGGAWFDLGTEDGYRSSLRHSESRDATDPVPAP